MKRRDKPSLRYKRSESGQGLVEYAVLLALVALAVIGAVMLSESSVNTAFNGAKDSVGGGGIDITPAAGQPLNPVGPNPTAANPPTATPIPPTSTPIPPTATPTTVPPATQTAQAANTATAVTIKTATASSNKTATASANAANATATAGFWTNQTAGAIATMTANSSSSAVRYGVDQYGWSNGNSTDGFSGNGTVVQSGNNGLTKVYLIGQPGNVLYFRIDTAIGSLGNGNTKVNYDAVNQAGQTPATNFQMSLTNGNFNGANDQIMATYNQQTPAVPIYVKVTLPTDICTGNNGPVRIQADGKSSGTGGADGVDVYYTCSATPTPTKAPTATPTITPVPPTNTPAPTPTQIQGGS